MPTNSVVLVTGALTGIGRATAVAFAQQGAMVVVSGRHPDAGELLVKELKDHGAADAAFIAADVRHDGEVRALVDGVVARFGRLDVAVNNAGSKGRPAWSRTSRRTISPRSTTPTCWARCCP
jgi:NAD(P)-dependent dehydrogenase (short-subunit alcohol dehydrogenase family)